MMTPSEQIRECKISLAIFVTGVSIGLSVLLYML